MQSFKSCLYQSCTNNKDLDWFAILREIVRMCLNQLKDSWIRWPSMFSRNHELRLVYTLFGAELPWKHEMQISSFHWERVSNTHKVFSLDPRKDYNLGAIVIVLVGWLSLTWYVCVCEKLKQCVVAFSLNCYPCAVC